jgi:hypothetical protein
MEKRLTAAAVEAKPIVNLNNLTFDLESEMLCQMVTDGIVEIRPFGKNQETIPCDCYAITVFANGNNIRIAGDPVRRTLTCAMDAKCERPEMRTFAFDPVERVKADRGHSGTAQILADRRLADTDRLGNQPLAHAQRVLQPKHLANRPHRYFRPWHPIHPRSLVEGVGSTDSDADRERTSALHRTARDRRNAARVASESMPAMGRITQPA